MTNTNLTSDQRTALANAGRGIMEGWHKEGADEIIDEITLCDELHLDEVAKRVGLEEMPSDYGQPRPEAWEAVWQGVRDYADEHGISPLTADQRDALGDAGRYMVEGAHVEAEMEGSRVGEETEIIDEHYLNHVAQRIGLPGMPGDRSHHAWKAVRKGIADYADEHGID